MALLAVGGSAQAQWLSRPQWLDDLRSISSGSPRAARYAVPEEPQWLRFRINEVSLKAEVENEKETITAKNVSEPFDRNRLSVIPLVGVEFEGSVYHPNLLEFSAAVDAGVDYENVKIKSSSESAAYAAESRNELGPLYRYHTTLAILKEKPYAVSLYADKDHGYRDYDYFSRADLETRRYGGNAGYTTGPVPVKLSFNHLEEDISGLSRTSWLREDTAAVTANNERGTVGKTDFSYTWEKFDRMDEDTHGQVQEHSESHTANLFDTEQFGQRDWMKLQSSLLGIQQDNNFMSTSSLVGHERLSLEHDPHLRSEYNMGYDMRTSGPTKSDGINGQAAVHHQLYESLHSTFDVHGQSLSTSSDSSSQNISNSQDITRIGVGWNETYTKKLGTWGRLNLGNSMRLDHEIRENSGGTLQIIDESHVLTDSVTTFLAQPNVVAGSIVVTDAANALIYREGLDYSIINYGTQTEIRRVFGGLIPNGGTVLVDYSASAQNSAAFNTLSDTAQIRLDLWGQLLGVYARWGYVQNYGQTEDLILQDINDTVFGLDSTWRWIRVGAEHEDFGSNLTPFTANRLYQSFSIQPTQNSNLGLDLAETWQTYEDQDRQQTIYSFTGFFQVRLLPSLTLSSEGGVRTERGKEMDHDLTMARAYLDFAMGQLTVKLGYEFQDEIYLGEQRQKHYLFLRAKRVF